MKFAASYSGGKDSVLALYKMIQQGHTPVALITTVNPGQERSWFHGIQNRLLLAASESMQIPLILAECSSDSYTDVFELCLDKAKRMGAAACVFGDVDIDEHMLWDKARCNEAGIECVLPLWKQDREAVVHEIIDFGFKAIIKTVDSSKLDDSFLGQELTVSLIKRLQKAEVDPCGENGEYHTFVYDGPIFSMPLGIETGKIYDLGTHTTVEIFG